MKNKRKPLCSHRTTDRKLNKLKKLMQLFRFLVVLTKLLQLRNLSRRLARDR